MQQEAVGHVLKFEKAILIEREKGTLIHELKINVMSCGNEYRSVYVHEKQETESSSVAKGIVAIPDTETACENKTDKWHAEREQEKENMQRGDSNA